jgi:hypothetical protein
MALQGISTGTIPNDGTGDSLLAGAIKVNENFLEVYNALGVDVGGDLTVTGVLTYEDVTNVDSIGVVTARDGVVVLGSGITVTGVSTFYDATFLDSRLQVAGLSTFSNNVDINASVDISTTVIWMLMDTQN